MTKQRDFWDKPIALPGTPTAASLGNARPGADDPTSAPGELGFPPPAKENPEILGRIWRWFLSRWCPACGKVKIPKECFCKRCYFALTIPQRNSLYVSALDGEEFYYNYYQALEALRKLGIK